MEGEEGCLKVLLLNLITWFKNKENQTKLVPDNKGTFNEIQFSQEKQYRELKTKD